MIRRICFVFGLVVLSASDAASQAIITATTRDARRFERLLRPTGRIAGVPDTGYSIAERMKYWNVPGVSIAIVDDFRIAYARGFGVTEFGGTKPVDTTTLFQAGSISKPVFATGALRLVEEGKLSLDEDVNAKLRSWRLPDSRFTATEKVTLRRILTHTAGLTVWGFPGYEAGTPVPTVQQVLDGAPPANTAPVRNDTIPGARWMYSGGGFTIAQLLAEDVSGESFPALMQRLVLAPAGMKRSTYENPLPRSRDAEAATGHERIDTPAAGRYHTYPEMAAAGLWTTASDLARWLIALSRSYNGQPGGLLSPDMARQMIAEHAAAQGGGFSGLGVAVSGSGDSIRFSHGGRDHGFVAFAVMWPKLGRGYVVMTNGVNGALINEIGRAIVETQGVGMTHLARRERTTIPVTPAVLAPLAGRYMLPGRDTTIFEVVARDTTLWITNTYNRRRYRLYPTGPDEFFDVNFATTFVFQRDSAGTGARSFRLGNAADAPTAFRQ